MTDQEIINNYLKRNPLKKNKTKQDKTYYQPCSACGKPVGSNLKRPATTYSGVLLDKFKDNIEDFPKDEKEDLCGHCITTIRNMNIDMSSDRDWCVKWVGSATLDDDHALNLEFASNEKSYQGYSSLDSMEGTYEQFEMRSDRSLKFDS